MPLSDRTLARASSRNPPHRKDSRRPRTDAAGGEDGGTAGAVAFAEAASRSGEGMAGAAPSRAAVAFPFKVMHAWGICTRKQDGEPDRAGTHARKSQAPVSLYPFECRPGMSPLVNTDRTRAQRPIP